ncbi:MAG TPA: hypothetical protein VKE70_38225, partial [Candidatus Solibacter sp.]|nr:hypothetical protein [Candidatus Solibacter sp.]
MTAISVLTEWTLRSAALIALGELLLRVFRIKEPAIRLASCTAILVTSLAIPALTALLPPLAFPVGRAAAVSYASQSPAPALTNSASQPATAPTHTAPVSP